MYLRKGRREIKLIIFVGGKGCLLLSQGILDLPPLFNNRGDMQIIEIFGFVGKEPDMRVTSSGKKVANFTVGVRAKKTLKEQVTIWYNVAAFDAKFDAMLSYVKKGTPIIVMGELLASSTYKDKSGQIKFNHNIVADFIRFSPFGNEEKRPSSPELSKQEELQEELPF